MQISAFGVLASAVEHLEQATTCSHGRAIVLATASWQTTHTLGPASDGDEVDREGAPTGAEHPNCSFRLVFN
jgi:hypothetical protein